VGLRTVVETEGETPLVAVGQVEGRRIGLLAFDLGESDLPLQIAFPLLMSNLVDFLLPAGEGILPPATALGEPIPLSLDPSLTTVTVIESGVETSISLAGGRGTLPGATRVGIRELRDAGGTSLGRVAANLFAPDESDVAPGDPKRIADMGRVPEGEGDDSQPARAEWWWPIALAALALLAAEWLLFHRPTRRSLARLAGRRAPLPEVRPR
jgi:Ca-activated chloride channel family protein